MDREIDIHKAGGVLISERKFLVAKSKGKNFFVAPGGKLEEGETAKEALRRELKEELAIDASELEPFGTYYAQAVGQEDKRLRMDVFIVRAWSGDPHPCGEVEEIAWINSSIPDGMRLGSVFEHEVLPRLKKENLID